MTAAATQTGDIVVILSSRTALFSEIQMNRLENSLPKMKIILVARDTTFTLRRASGTDVNGNSLSARDRRTHAASHLSGFTLVRSHRTRYAFFRFFAGIRSNGAWHCKRIKIPFKIRIQYGMFL